MAAACVMNLCRIPRTHHAGMSADQGTPAPQADPAAE